MVDNPDKFGQLPSPKAPSLAESDELIKVNREGSADREKLKEQTQNENDDSDAMKKGPHKL